MLVKMRVARDAPKVARDEITDLPEKFALMWIELGWCDAVPAEEPDLPADPEELIAGDLIPEIETQPKKRR